jgi:hypothetical protein
MEHRGWLFDEVLGWSRVGGATTVSSRPGIEAYYGLFGDVMSLLYWSRDDDLLLGDGARTFSC